MISLRPHHIFQYNGDTCLINIETLDAFHLDTDTHAALEGLAADPAYVLTEKTQADLERLSLLSPAGGATQRHAASESRPIPIHGIALFLTQGCNLRCTYCYGGGGHYGAPGDMDRKTALASVDWLIENSRQLPTPAISFFGGEPLMNFELMKEVVAYARARGSESDKKFKFWVTTNTTLLDDEKIAFMADNEVNPIVSIDGARDIHDAQRPFPSGKGSFDVMIPKIRKLLEVFPDAKARATLVGDTDPLEVTEALRQIGFNCTHISLVSDSLLDPEGSDAVENRNRDGDGRNLAANSRSHAAESRNHAGMVRMMEADVEQLLADVKNRDAASLRDKKDTGLLVKMLGRFVNHEKRHIACEAGRTYVAVSNAGDIYLCHRFVGTDAFRLGTVFDGPPANAEYRDRSAENVAGCSSCFARYVCAGGCYHDNLCETGSAFQPSNGYCWMMQRLTELIAYSASRLDEEDKAFLVEHDVVPSTPCLFDFPA
jgi:uncharacterized protein